MNNPIEKLVSVTYAEIVKIVTEDRPIELVNHARFILKSLTKDKDADPVLLKINTANYYSLYESWCSKDTEWLKAKHLSITQKLKTSRDVIIIEVLLLIHLIKKRQGYGSKVIWRAPSGGLRPPPYLPPESVLLDWKQWLLDRIDTFREVNITETVAEFAENDRYISSGLTATPGKFSFDRTPYMREPAEELSPQSSTRQLYLMKAAQVGGNTGLAENLMGFCVKYGIGPMLFVSADGDIAAETMEKRIDDVIYGCGLEDKIAPNTQKKHKKATGDTKVSKMYGGTFMRAVGPNSEGKLRSFPIRILILDETDVYPPMLRGGGNTIEKAMRRVNTYAKNKQEKVFGLSTPKDQDASNIYPLFLRGDQRYYYTVCKYCGELQIMKWSQFRWEKDETGQLNIETKEVNGRPVITNRPVWYECIKCKGKWYESDRDFFLSEEKGAIWKPTVKAKEFGVRSYHIPGFFYRNWLDMIQQWQNAQMDKSLLNDFINDVLGEPSTDMLSKPTAENISHYASDRERCHIPDDVLFLTLQADIQGNRIEAGLMGWGKKEQIYFLDYWVFPESLDWSRHAVGADAIQGNPTDHSDSTWEQLSERILRTYKTEDGRELKIIMSLIDAGFQRDVVNSFCDGFSRENSISGVYPCAGRQTLTQGRRCKLVQNDIETPMVMLNDQFLKKELYNKLSKRPHKDGGFPFGFIHFPDTFPPAFYKQLVAEDIIRKVSRAGIETITIENQAQRRNEALDIAKMGLGAKQLMKNLLFDMINKQRQKDGFEPLDNMGESFFINTIEEYFEEVG